MKFGQTKTQVAAAPAKKMVAKKTAKAVAKPQVKNDSVHYHMLIVVPTTYFLSCDNHKNKEAILHFKCSCNGSMSLCDVGVVTFLF